MKIIHTKTKQEWIDVVKKAISEGYRWCDSDEVAEKDWDDYKEKSVIFLEDNNLISYADTEWALEYYDTPIISAQMYLEDTYTEWGYKQLTNNYPSSEQNKDEDRKMNKLSKTLKRVLNKNLQKLYKVGYINGDLELTPRGKDALNNILLEEYEEKLAKLAEEEIKEYE